MAILGIDLGYSFTKTSEGFICPSKVTKAEPVLGHQRTLDLGGERYYVGVGHGTVDPDKADHELTKVLLLYSICTSTNDSQVRVVTGLPISQYQAHKDELRDRVMACSGKVGYNGHPRDIRITDCLVRPQGVLGNGLSVDIGGRTTDIALVVNGQLEYAKTLYEGMILLYSRIMDAINTRYSLTLPDHYAQTILTEGLMLKEEKQDISFILPILADFVDRIVDEIVLSSAVSKAILLGGGAKLLYAAIAKRYPSILAAEPQFTNAYIFKKVGDRVWS